MSPNTAELFRGHGGLRQWTRNKFRVRVLCARMPATGSRWVQASLFGAQMCGGSGGARNQFHTRAASYRDAQVNASTATCVNPKRSITPQCALFLSCIVMQFLKRANYEPSDYDKIEYCFVPFAWLSNNKCTILWAASVLE